MKKKDEALASRLMKEKGTVWSVNAMDLLFRLAKEIDIDQTKLRTLHKDIMAGLGASYMQGYEYGLKEKEGK